MIVKTLDTNLTSKTGNLSLVSGETGLPYIVAGIWLSLYEHTYSQSYTQKHLRSLKLLYVHCERQFEDPSYLDRIILQGNIDAILASMKTFVAERQNFSAITGTDQSITLRLTTSIIKDVLDEIRYRNNSPNFDGAKITRNLSKLDSLYRFLRPPRASKHIKTRSLPELVLSELFSTLRPNSNKNPYRNDKLRQRNFVIFALLYQMGLRRGELLNLTSDCMKAGYDVDQARNLYWLDITLPQTLDPRAKKPELKNEYSPRQIPLPYELYKLLINFVSNYRGRESHGFLFSSQRGMPLSERALNDISVSLALNLSVSAKRELKNQCGLETITPHNFRHSAAVDRIRAYRHSGIEMNKAEALMRAFFGWSPQSKMPLLYARAFYEEQLNTTWLQESDQRIKGIMGYE